MNASVSKLLFSVATRRLENQRRHPFPKLPSLPNEQGAYSGGDVEGLASAGKTDGQMIRTRASADKGLVASCRICPVSALHNQINTADPCNSWMGRENLGRETVLAARRKESPEARVELPQSRPFRGSARIQAESELRRIATVKVSS